MILCDVNLPGFACAITSPPVPAAYLPAVLTAPLHHVATAICTPAGLITTLVGILALRYLMVRDEEEVYIVDDKVQDSFKVRTDPVAAVGIGCHAWLVMACHGLSTS